MQHALLQTTTTIVNDEYVLKYMYVALFRHEIVLCLSLFYPCERLCFLLCRQCALLGDLDECTHTDDQRTLYGNWCDTELKFACDNGYVVKRIFGCIVWEYTCKMAERYFSILKWLKLLCSVLPSTVVTDEDLKVFFEELSRKANIVLDPKDRRPI